MALKASLEKLIESGAHYGHQARRWNPKMQPYLYGVQEGVHVFDLIKTKKALDEALEVLEDYSSKGKTILFLGTKKQAKDKLRAMCMEAECPFVDERWLGGTLTNFDQIKKSTTKLVDMKEKMAKGEYKQFTKKERLLLEREIARLNRFFGGIVNLQALPDLLVVIDIKREHAAVKEAKMKGVATIGIVDSNSDPTKVDYPIPMNDDASGAIEYVISLFGEAIIKGKKKKPKKKTQKKAKKK